MATTMDFSVERGVDIDLCDLLETMTLDTRWVSGSEKDESTASIKATPAFTLLPDALMSEDPSYHSDESESSTASPSSSSGGGCALLQAIRAGLEGYPTTGGEYLEAIFMHREVFTAFPPAHRACADAFTDIAFAMERRTWRPDRDADSEAVAAFHYEAWMLARALGS